MGFELRRALVSLAASDALVSSRIRKSVGCKEHLVHLIHCFHLQFQMLENVHALVDIRSINLIELLVSSPPSIKKGGGSIGA